MTAAPDDFLLPAGWWTEAEIAALRAAREAGQTYAAIAASVLPRRSPAALRSRWAMMQGRRAGAPTAAGRQRAYRPYWSAAESAVFHFMLAGGRTDAEIAAATGRSRRAVGLRRQAWGETRFRCRPWSPADDRGLRSAAGQGDTIGSMAAMLGRTPDAVRRRLRKLAIAPSPRADQRPPPP